ncbi:MAG: MarR family transcriptional regulator [Streptosporangiales bacterium]|nr:MarR family transcriptional regulator [Streptosporangiales bacterium]
MQSEMLPSVLRVFDNDDHRLIHSAMLAAIDGSDALTVNQLAHRIGRSVSRTSRVVEQLVSRGLVERVVDADDRRVRRVRLTADGTALLRRVQQLRVTALEELVDHLTDVERKQVVEAMDLLVVAARRYGDGARAGNG